LNLAKNLRTNFLTKMEAKRKHRSLRAMVAPCALVLVLVVIVAVNLYQDTRSRLLASGDGVEGSETVHHQPADVPDKSRRMHSHRNMTQSRVAVGMTFPVAMEHDWEEWLVATLFALQRLLLKHDIAAVKVDCRDRDERCQLAQWILWPEASSEKIDSHNSTIDVTLHVNTSDRSAALAETRLPNKDETILDQIRGRRSTPSRDPEQLLVCYLDYFIDASSPPLLQHAVPSFEHEWLLDNLQNHPLVQFQHIPMNLSQVDVEQSLVVGTIRTLSSCDVLVGGILGSSFQTVPGNGSTTSWAHLFPLRLAMLFLRPQRHVLELYWYQRFSRHTSQHAATAHLQHYYRAWFNGYPLAPLDDEAAVHWDPRLLPDLNTTMGQMTPAEELKQYLQRGRNAMLDFLHQAVVKRNL
jgi:hypothetical protein